MDERKLRECIELLCGQRTAPTAYSTKFITGFPGGGLGRSQLNEVLLAYQLDRIDEGLFRFIFKEEPINNPQLFVDKISEFRILGAVHFGNFKYAYKFLRNKKFEEIVEAFGGRNDDIEATFRSRHSPVVDLQSIEPKDTYFLGYIVNNELKQREADKEFSQKVKDIRERGGRLIMRYTWTTITWTSTLRPPCARSWTFGT